MRYFKTVIDGYINSISTGCGGVEITKDEYDTIKAVIRSVPESPDGYDYALKEDLTWELYDLTVVEDELTDEEALAIILGGEA